MNKKGFTLIELLAVIAILGIIAVITVPTVINVLNPSKEKAGKSNEAIIEQAASKWMVYKGNLDSGSCFLKLSTLISDGYVSTKIKDPQTGKEISDEAGVLVSYTSDENSKKYKYEYYSSYNGITNGEGESNILNDCDDGNDLSS